MNRRIAPIFDFLTLSLLAAMMAALTWSLGISLFDCELPLCVLSRGYGVVVAVLLAFPGFWLGLLGVFLGGTPRRRWLSAICTVASAVVFLGFAARPS